MVMHLSRRDKTLNMEIFVDNDNVLTIDKLRDVLTPEGQYINNATVTATLKDLRGREVGGESWPLSVPYVTNSDGKYQAILEEEIRLATSQPYRLEIRVDAGTDRIATFSILTAALRRTA